MPKNQLQENYLNIKGSLPTNVQLVAVSKTKPAEQIQDLYDVGQRVFGENKVQELVEKHDKLPHDIQWHLIGHLQTNKVKYVAPFVDTIQSVDSEKVLKEINKQAYKNQRVISILLQIKIAEEDTKFGLSVSEAKEILDAYLNDQYPHVKINGLMGMATLTEDQSQIRREFKLLKSLYDEFSSKTPMNILSMGMSNDYELAINSGATSVRIGSAIFGSRSDSL